MATSKYEWGEMRCPVHGLFHGLTCPACEDSLFVEAWTITQERDYLPQEWHGRVWSLLDDPTALDVGNLVFDPKNYAYYAGIVTAVDKNTNGRVISITVEWYKAADNKMIDHFGPASMQSNFLWADPMLQGD